MNRITTLIRRLFALSFVRFAFVGGIASAIHYGIYLFILQAHLNLTLTYTIAFLVSVICNYFMTSYFTFKVRPQWRKAFKFLTAHLINLTNELLLFNLVLYLGISAYYAPPCVFLIAFPINYFMVKFALGGKLFVKNNSEKE